MLDTSNLPISGGALLAIGLYALASLGAGQLVGMRTVEASGWLNRCEAGLRAQIEERKRPLTRAPETDCDSFIGKFHPDLSQLCWQFGNPDLAGPGAKAARELERKAEERRNKTLSRAAAAAGSRCDCAAVTYTREQMIPLGVYAGTARLVTLPGVSRMDSGLSQALGSGYCPAGTEDPQ